MKEEAEKAIGALEEGLADGREGKSDVELLDLLWKGAAETAGKAVKAVKGRLEAMSGGEAGKDGEGMVTAVQILLLGRIFQEASRDLDAIGRQAILARRRISGREEGK